MRIYGFKGVAARVVLRKESSRIVKTKKKKQQTQAKRVVSDNQEDSDVNKVFLKLDKRYRQLPKKTASFIDYLYIWEIHSPKGEKGKKNKKAENKK